MLIGPARVGTSTIGAMLARVSGFDGRDYLVEWVASEQNRGLADDIVFTDGRSAQEVAERLGSDD